MIESIFKHIAPNIKDGKIKDLKQLLKETGIYKSFEEIYADYGNDGDKVATYILLAYCTDSTFVVSGNEWSATKRGIMEIVGLDTEKYLDVISNSRQSLKDAIIAISSELKDWRYGQIIIWKESALMLDEIATSKPDVKSKTPSKNIRDAAIYSNELKEKAESLEKQLLQQTRSKERKSEVEEIGIANMSYELILKKALNKE